MLLLLEGSILQCTQKTYTDFSLECDTFLFFATFSPLIQVHLERKRTKSNYEHIIYIKDIVNINRSMLKMQKYLLKQRSKKNFKLNDEFISKDIWLYHDK